MVTPIQFNRTRTEPVVLACVTPESFDYAGLVSLDDVRALLASMTPEQRAEVVGPDPSCACRAECERLRRQLDVNTADYHEAQQKAQEQIAAMRPVVLAAEAYECATKEGRLTPYHSTNLCERVRTYRAAQNPCAGCPEDDKPIACRGCKEPQP